LQARLGEFEQGFSESPEESSDLPVAPGAAVFYNGISIRQYVFQKSTRLPDGSRMEEL